MISLTSSIHVPSTNKFSKNLFFNMIWFEENYEIIFFYNLPMLFFKCTEVVDFTKKIKTTLYYKFSVFLVIIDHYFIIWKTFVNSIQTMRMTRRSIGKWQYCKMFVTLVVRKLNVFTSLIMQVLFPLWLQFVFAVESYSNKVFIFFLQSIPQSLKNNKEIFANYKCKKCNFEYNLLNKSSDSDVWLISNFLHYQKKIR